MKITRMWAALDTDLLFLKPKSVGTQMSSQTPGQQAGIMPGSKFFPSLKSSWSAVSPIDRTARRLTPVCSVHLHCRCPRPSLHQPHPASQSSRWMMMDLFPMPTSSSGRVGHPCVFSST